ncbi:uncharacterized protein MONBRDRAFT_10752 [Monosiga brevicollis MX1]|uniref:Protein kinase C n=1 Tax=Monosiga brevicollis TaxID=81824 RepID=A9V750_MONBE|nr:uncharacterized protein MONBRDRAFT_10752 [Monosiga brevicollis MX1]EDQ86659.1 predicted protein [Monosiga brevicollis MX1]|eukprot:XP_001748495.1 hypothetical protein [Monosiga brevicollis MX1]
MASVSAELDKRNERRKLKQIASEFARTDKDGSGDIDLQEIGEALSKLGKSVNRAELKAAIRRVDDDDSGTLRYREFINLILLETGFISDPVAESARKTSLGVGLGRGKRKGALKKKKRGQIKLNVSLNSNGDNVDISVEVLQAANLLPADITGLADPYVKMYIQPDPSKKTKQKTKVVKKSLNPEWNEKFTWTLSSATKLEHRFLTIEVWDWDRITRNDFMGAMAFELKELEDPDTIKAGWFILLDQEQGRFFNFPSAIQPKSVRPAAPARGHSVRARDSKLSSTPKKSGLRVEDFKFVKVLGRGSFGKVFLAERKTDQKMYAVKALKKVRVIEDDDVGATITEKEVLALGAQAPFMVQLVASFQNQDHLFFVMELVAGGDLMFHAMKHGAFSEKASAFYSAEISAGLMYLHERGILYRDLKLDNVMLDEEGHVRLADFGLCKQNVAPADGSTQTFCGTPNYLAPEIVSYKPYTKAVDWWSLGVIMFEMMNGIVLFDGQSEKELYRNILNQQIDLPRTMSAEARATVSAFLTRRPAERLGAGPSERRDVQATPFFKDIDWAKLEKRAVPPPFAPKVRGAKDASNFDPEFTAEKPVLTPEDSRALAAIDQAFAGLLRCPANQSFQKRMATHHHHRKHPQ